MPSFQYTAIKVGDKTKIDGVIQAETEREAREMLRQNELYPTSLKVVTNDAPKVASATKKGAPKKELSGFEQWVGEALSSVGMQEKISFTQNLEIMVRAGIPITEALLYMESYMDNPKFRKLLNTLRLDILSGYSFSRALGKHAKVFDEVYVNIVNAGEASGELEAVLKRLADLLVAQSKLQKKVISAMVYPVMVIVIVVIVLLVMFIFVLPTFSEMYNKMGIKLPLITQIMIGISDFLRNYWYIAIAITGALGFSWWKFSNTPTGKRFVDTSALNIPVVGPLVKAVSASHFLSTLHISFSAGLPITDCMMMACQTIQNGVIKDIFDQVNYKIQAGGRIASSISETDMLPGMVVIMISSGEEAGNLEEMLVHAIGYLEEEVNQKVEILMSMMEPVLLIVLGVIVGCMALSIYLPLFGMYEHVGGH